MKTQVSDARLTIGLFLEATMLVLSSFTETTLGLVQDVNFPKSGNILCSSLFRKCSEHDYVPWSSTRPKADNQENYELPCLIRLAYHFSSDAEPLSETSTCRASFRLLQSRKAESLPEPRWM